MRETLKHKEAFEFYYQVRSLRKVAQKFNTSLTTAFNWYKAFNWKERVKERDLKNFEELEKQTDGAVLNLKKDFLKTILQVYEALKERIEGLVIPEIKNLQDFERLVNILDKLARLELFLTEGKEETEKDNIQIIVRNEETKELIERLVNGGNAKKMEN